MTLQPLILDDLDWQQMVEAIRRRVPAESGGTWTLHSPVDPGITLLELFAYLLEQRLFSLDQVPTDALVLAVLRLLGLDDPKLAQAAGTVLRLRAGQPGGDPLVLPEGTVFARDPQQQVAFTIAAATTVLPVNDAGIRLWAGGRERSADLAAQRPVPLFAPGTGPVEARIMLPLSGVPAADTRPAAGSALSLLVRIAAPDECPAAWLPTAVTGVQPPANLVWSWYLPDTADPSTGTDLPAVDPQSAADGTAGLRRSGVLRLPLPGRLVQGRGGPGTGGLRAAAEHQRRRLQRRPYAAAVGPEHRASRAPEGAAGHRAGRGGPDPGLAAAARPAPGPARRPRDAALGQGHHHPGRCRARLGCGARPYRIRPRRPGVRAGPGRPARSGSATG